jgi:hypothetical protein
MGWIEDLIVEHGLEAFGTEYRGHISRNPVSLASFCEVTKFRKGNEDHVRHRDLFIMVSKYAMQCHPYLTPMNLSQTHIPI